MSAFTAPAWARLLTVLGFVAFGVGTVFYLLTKTGIDMPLVEDIGTYEVALEVSDVDNLEEAGHVRIAGVRVGEVQSREVIGDHARVVLSLYNEYAPLHKGATVRIGNKSLVEETYLDITDGNGAAIPSGTTLPRSAVQHSTQLHDILASLDPKTRTAMGSFLRSVGAGTKGTQRDIAQLFSGLGDLGRQGHTALDAVAAQSEDLRALARETTAVLTALDTGEGQLARMVGNADRLTAATAGQRHAIEATMRKLPGLLDSTRTASGQLTELSGSLGPVAADLRTAAPALTKAMRQLPAASRDLRGMMPALTRVLDRSSATLNRVPTFGRDLRGIFPKTREILRDVNPMLAYLRPYGSEFGAFVANFNAISGYADEAGVHYFRLFQLYNDSSLSSPTDFGYPGAYKNAIPEPGTGGTPGPFTGEYPRVERAPR